MSMSSKFANYQDLLANLDNDEGRFIRLLEECREEGPGSTNARKFLIRFLKQVFEPSLLYRLHPTGTGVNDMNIFKYGTRYYEFPDKLLAIIVAFMKEKFPLPESDSRLVKQSIDVYLSNCRKMRASQMRAYISTLAISALHAHPLFFAIAWDTHTGSGVFRSAAPIWPGNTVDEKDNYLASYQGDWAAVSAGILGWETNLPPRWDATPSRFGVPPIPSD